MSAVWDEVGKEGEEETELAGAGGRGFSPWIEELELLLGKLIPQGHERLVRLASLVPFERAAALFGDFMGIEVSLSYFSCKVSAQEFQQLSLVETHHRGVKNAKAVVAVMDGAE